MAEPREVRRYEHLWAPLLARVRGGEISLETAIPALAMGDISAMPDMASPRDWLERLQEVLEVLRDHVRADSRPDVLLVWGLHLSSMAMRFSAEFGGPGGVVNERK